MTDAVEYPNEQTDMLYFVYEQSFKTAFDLLYMLLPAEQKEALWNLFSDLNTGWTELSERSRANIAVDAQIKIWRGQTTEKLTSVIVKVINNTDYHLKIDQTNLILPEQYKQTAVISQNMPTAFKFVIPYTPYKFKLNAKRQKVFFDKFMVFSDEDVSVNFQFGLKIGITFGIIGETETPHPTASTYSLGKEPIQCVAKVVQHKTDAPWHFEVEVTLD